MKVMKAMQLSGRSPLSAVAFFAVLASVIAGPLAAVNQQLPIPNDFQQPQLRRAKVAERKLTGKFLHITDRFYIPGSKTDSTEACHRGKGNAGSLGAPGTDCDSPESLVNQTFDWIEENLRDQIDFVVWTGDSARHDNDERIPRTENQIEEFNEVLATKFVDTFSHRRNNPDRNLIIPIVPNIGNNDIMPHNVFEKGPNRWTQMLARLWNPFIPEEQRHTFIEGGYFRTDVIPNKLAVFSLNTLYFFDSNPAVDGCAQKSEPGYQQMEWLRVQLQLVRERGMKALLTGHVPPARSSDKQAWDETCWQKYTLWLQQYRDIVVGGLFGHMNIDHFMFQDAKEIDINAVLSGDHMPAITAENSYDNFTIASKGSYLSSLRNMWARLPTPPASVIEEEWSKSETHDDGIDSTRKKKHRKEKKAREKRKFFKKIGGEYAERFSVSLVSPSVVPNYYPSLRVIEYDITGLEEAPTWSEIQLAGTTGDEKQTEHEIEVLKKSKKTPIPDPPSKSDPPGPAYSKQPLTLLNIAQYYANITQEKTPKTTGPSTHSDTNEPLSEGYRLAYELEYRTDEDDIYMLQDLTVRSIYNLATRIGTAKSSSSSSHLETSAQEDIDRKNNDGDQTEAESRNDVKHAKTKEIKKRKPGKDNDSWKTFVERAFVGFLAYNEVEEKL